MQSNTSHPSRAARVIRDTNPPLDADSWQRSKEATCPACGYQGRPTLAGGYGACYRCGAFINADAADDGTRSNSWAAYWGDALVIVALSVLAYLLTAMTLDAFSRP